MSLTARLIAAAALVSCAAGCTAAPGEAGPPPAEFTRDMAESTLARIVTGVAENGVTGFCARHVRGAETCAMLLDDALRSCLLPGGKPEVTRAVRIPPKDHSEGGWLLELHGRTMDGQRYVSEFFAVRTGGEPPQAAFGVYWTGSGPNGDPSSPIPKVPRNACPGKEATRAGS